MSGFPLLCCVCKEVSLLSIYCHLLDVNIKHIGEKTHHLSTSVILLSSGYIEKFSSILSEKLGFSPSDLVCRWSHSSGCGAR